MEFKLSYIFLYFHSYIFVLYFSFWLYFIKRLSGPLDLIYALSQLFTPFYFSTFYRLLFLGIVEGTSPNLVISHSTMKLLFSHRVRKICSFFSQRSCIERILNPKDFCTIYFQQSFS